MSMIPSSVFGNVVYDPMVPFYLDAWDPFRDVNSHIAPPHAFPHKTSSPFANTHIDWKETPEAHVFTADIPGLKKEEVKVQVEEGKVLSISGEKFIEKEEKTDKWHRVERSSGKFLRRFRLPENAKLEKVTAYIDNGVLTVTVPKEETHHVRSIEIK